MPGVSMTPSNVAVRRAPMSLTNCSAAGERCITIRPGLVQNWPTPTVDEAYKPSTKPAARSAMAPGKMNTGLTLPISA
jgi:hypothetical protein